MSSNSFSSFQYTDLTPATTLREVRRNFDPQTVVDPNSEFYIKRTDPGLKMLAFQLADAIGITHAFLCGHGGSGKTTELNRLCNDPEILERYYPVYLTTEKFDSEAVHLTHDAVMVEIVKGLLEAGDEKGLPSVYREDFEKWGQKVVKTFISDDKLKGDIGAKFSWFALFRAQLSTRQEWKREEKELLEPKVQELIELMNQIARELELLVEKKLLIIIDDLEKGDSEAHKKMHDRLFKEHYEILAQPACSIIYTVPISVRADQERRIPSEQLYTFSAVRLYEQENKNREKPPVDKEGEGYQLMKAFVEKRIDASTQFYDEDVLEEILRIGGGLFRETGRAIRDAAYNAIIRGSENINLDDVEKVFNLVKKEFQPLIRGEAVGVLKEVMNTPTGWVPGVEPFLRSRAVVEYENGNLWIDLRHVLKPYIRQITSDET